MFKLLLRLCQQFANLDGKFQGRAKGQPVVKVADFPSKMFQVHGTFAARKASGFAPRGTGGLKATGGPLKPSGRQPG
ncbi:hypothetical protein AYO44_10555 [Planctomycetaceae bacterium SCGC AG-212-F19]|nr:hypothetical protein AYO44_10555 [Planctomycetaceae bacterium SCGC AG-212-F19]